MERTEHMAVNKITHSWNEDYTGLIFTGSQRQPTPVEVHNYCVAQHIPLEGVYIRRKTWWRMDTAGGCKEH